MVFFIFYFNYVGVVSEKKNSTIEKACGRLLSVGSFSRASNVFVGIDRHPLSQIILFFGNSKKIKIYDVRK